MISDCPVSVILVVKNGERYIRQAIESIKNQDAQPHEILVVDGHSTDATSSIACSFPGVTWIVQPGQGISEAYNLGIQSATAKYLAFISHDDVWEADKLQIQFQQFLDDSELDYSITWFDYFMDSNSKPSPAFRKELLNSHHIGKFMETLMVKRNVFNRIGFFDTAMAIASDADWFARAQDAKLHCHLVEKVLLHKRVHDQNTSLNYIQNNAELLLALKRSIDRKKQVK